MPVQPAPLAKQNVPLNNCTTWVSTVVAALTLVALRLNSEVPSRPALPAVMEVEMSVMPIWVVVPLSVAVTVGEPADWFWANVAIRVALAAGARARAPKAVAVRSSVTHVVSLRRMPRIGTDAVEHGWKSSRIKLVF